MPPLVSIIIPTHNSGGFIAETISSVRAQTWPTWEAVVTDDGSTDDTVEIVRRLAAEDQRIVLVENAAMGHAGANRNRGLDAARGDYVAFLDADDLWAPEKLEVQLGVIQGREKPGAVFSPAEDFNDGPVPFQRFFYNAPPPPDRMEQYRQLLLKGDHYSTSSLLLTREFVEEIGRFSEADDLRSGQDTDFLARAIWRRPMIFAPGALVKMRNRLASLTARNMGNWMRYFAIAREAERRGELPEPLRSQFLSMAWLVRGENFLARGESGWRAAFVNSFRLNARDPRRWPLPVAAAMSRGAARSFLAGLKLLQAKLT